MASSVIEVPAHPDPRFKTRPVARDKVNIKGLEAHLRRHVAGEVRFDAGTLAMYANDASNFRQVPIGVVIPKTLDDVVETHKACHKYGAPVLCRGGGTSLSGETVNVAVVIDFSKYLTTIEHFDVDERTVTAQTGVINEQLKKQLGSRPVRIEGYNSAEWVLLDYGDFIVHIFNGEARDFYDLARLWRDARKVEIPADIA